MSNRSASPASGSLHAELRTASALGSDPVGCGGNGSAVGSAVGAPTGVLVVRNSGSIDRRSETANSIGGGNQGTPELNMRASQIGLPSNAYRYASPAFYAGVANKEPVQQIVEGGQVS